jgi:hypothetical protein
MSDPPGVPPPLGIEVVEWIAEGGENLTVRVTGRWRRRRPAWSGQPTLVIEAPGRRYRFPAMPEPPSLTGAAPGMWRISFAVPAALAPDLGGRAWLQFGAVAVPLPAAIEPLGGGVIGDQPEAVPAPATESEPEAVAALPPPRSEEQPQPSSELEVEAARRRAADAEAEVRELAVRVDGLERELAAARSEADRLSTSIAGQAQARRVAEQRAHGERAQSLDLARQLAQQMRDRDRVRQALGDLATAEERIRALERELIAARRRIDEAEQTAAAANAARQRTERRVGEVTQELERMSARPSEQLAPAEHQRLGLERELVTQREATDRRVAREPQAPAVVAAEHKRRLPASRAGAAPEARIETLVVALRTELDLRARSEANLRARLVDAEARLAAREHLSERTGEVLAQLRQELDGLRTAIEHEREAREAAHRRADELERELSGQRERSRHACEAIAELRAELDAIRAAEAQAAAQAELEPAAQAEVAAAAKAVQAEPEPQPESAAEVEPEAVVEGDPPGRKTEAVEAPPAGPEPEAAPERLNEALGRLRHVIPPLDAEPQAPATEAAAPDVPAEAPPAEADDPREPRGTQAPETPPQPQETRPPEAPPVSPGPDVAPPAKGGFAYRAWLQPVFRSLVKTDPDRAGRLLVDLLPAQRAVHPDPLAYDLVLGGDQGCARVTVSESGSRVVLEDRTRDLRDVDFQVVGDYAAIARLLLAGPIRRRLDRNVARVHGNRKAISALEALVGLRLDLTALYREGVRMGPRTALTVTAELIQPEWTTGVRFCIAYESRWAETVYLVVNDGAPVEVVGEAPGGWVSTAISGQAGAYELLLTGARPVHATVTGDEWPLTLVGKWIKRAQSD